MVQRWVGFLSSNVNWVIWLHPTLGGYIPFSGTATARTVFHFREMKSKGKYVVIQGDTATQREKKNKKSNVHTIYITSKIPTWL